MTAPAFVAGPIRRRFRERLAAALSLARTQRFVEMLEPSSPSATDGLDELAREFHGWRRALREGREDAALDALERTFAHLERRRAAVMAQDARIEAFRVRWACENAALSFATLDGLGRFYRTLPLSTASQSKYEYVLTRLLAGPIGPDRRLVSTDELLEIVGRLEDQWSAAPMKLEDAAADEATGRLKAFAHEAAEQPDAAAFTASAI